MKTIIDARLAVEPSSHTEDDPGATPWVLSTEEADFEKMLGRPARNKRENKEQAERRRNDLEALVLKKVARRSLAKDWARIVLEDLTTQQKYVEQSGISGYFVNSIARLEEIQESDEES